jgi:hypothetical protein
VTDEGSDVTISISEQSLSERANDLAAFFRGKLYGDIQVLSSTGAPEKDDDGNDAIRIILVLSDPSADTWDTDSVLDLRREMLERVRDMGIASLVYVNLSPNTDEPQAEDAEFEDQGTQESISDFPKE